MSPVSQSLLSRFAVATSVFALVAVGVVAATDGGSSGGGGGGAAAPVAVSLTEFEISPSNIVVPVGGSIQVTNDGTVDHDVTVLDTDIKSATLGAGGSELVDLSSLAPGTYELFCSISGHKDSGMTATLTISEDGSGGGGGSGEGHEGHTDIGSLERTDPMAIRINKEMEEAMTQGVQDFLANAELYAAGDVTKGNVKLEPEVLADGTKRFELTSAVTDWEVSPGKVVKAWTYNGIVPGPWIRVEPNDDVEVVITNELPLSTDIHFHGVDVPNEADGLAPITQDYIRPGETYTYKFNVGPNPQLAMYHAHFHGHEAIVNGMFAIFQVGDVPLPDAGRYGMFDVPEDLTISQEIPMVLNDAGVIGMSLNGKGFPLTEPIVADQGEYLLLHYYNEGLVGHPMHLHRQPHLVIAKDGFPLDAPYQVDTLWVSPGERYTVLIKASELGVWAFHCHILNHAESDDGLFGMVTAMIVNDPEAA